MPNQTTQAEKGRPQFRESPREVVAGFNQIFDQHYALLAQVQQQQQANAALMARIEALEKAAAKS